ncbi:hypothetical protein R3P38DRAFT_2996312 [Favolaschia claudopus]|uniref:Uncharacterized protein n=1 Tax=Favolaschia claudopus TaxID=2862362 RepID=A0AAW0ATH4_9AGAR
MDANQTPSPDPVPIPVFTSDNDAVHTACMAGLMLDLIKQGLPSLLASARTFRENADACPWQQFRPPQMESITSVISAVDELRDLMLCRQYHAPDPRPATVSDTPTPPTFAEAVKASPEPAQTRPQQTSKPRRQPAAARHDTAKPSRRTPPSTRLIVDLSGCHPTKKPHPASLCSALNDALGGRLAVSAVSTARSGNLILHASAPACSAQALAAHRSLVWSTISPLLGITDSAEPPMYPADPWHKVVFHRVPLMQPGALPSDRDFIREVAKRNQLPGTQYRIGNVRFLLERDKAPREEVTVRVDFIEQEDARRFLRDGIFLFGSHCRATRYKPRSSNGRRTSGGHG